MKCPGAAAAQTAAPRPRPAPQLHEQSRAPLVQVAPPKDAQVIADEVDPERLQLTIGRLVGFQTRHTLSETDSETRGIGAARRWIKAELERASEEATGSGPPLSVQFDSHHVPPDGRRIVREVDIVNVVATLPGTMPEAKQRLHYVVAHYDSRATDPLNSTAAAPGANDDGSGVAVVMELARIFAKRSFDATVVFMATAGEEQGLYGAKLHARAAHAAGADVVAVLNNDIVGDPTGPDGDARPKEIRVFSDGIPAAVDESTLKLMRVMGAPESPSRSLARYVREVGDWYGSALDPVLIYRPDRFLRGGDHSAFHAEGFAAIRFCEPLENYARQHQDPRTEDGRQYGDLPQFVDPLYLSKVTQLNALVLANLANAPSAPKSGRIVTHTLTNDTTLTWQANTEPDLAGYEIVWRPTTSPVWKHAKDVGPALEATLAISKDNVVFGIRAYDDEGYRSLVTIPVPEGK